MEKLKIALDWWPNVLQIGFFVAEAKGFYKEAGVEPEWIFPDVDRYRVMPSEKARTGVADLAVNPPENLLYANSKPGDKLVPLAALVQKNTSCMAVTDEGLSRIAASSKPIRYASLGLPYEEHTVRTVVNACFPGKKIEFLHPQKDEIYPDVLENRADMAWIFEPIEGVEWEAAGKHPHFISLHDASIPYPCCPLLMAGEKTWNEKQSLIQKFIDATGRGYVWTVNNPEKACDVLCNRDVNTYPVTVLKMIEKLSGDFLDQNKQWGAIDAGGWAAYENWLASYELISKNRTAAGSAG